jgi:hypothetical protein
VVEDGGLGFTLLTSFDNGEGDWRLGTINPHSAKLDPGKHTFSGSNSLEEETVAIVEELAQALSDTGAQARDLMEDRGTVSGDVFTVNHNFWLGNPTNNCVEPYLADIWALFQRTGEYVELWREINIYDDTFTL